MTLHKLILLLSFLAGLLGSYQAQASHFTDAKLNYRSLGNNEYLVELSTIYDCNAIPLPTSIGITAQSTSCGTNLNIVLPKISSTDITPVCPGGTSPCQTTNGYGILRVVYADTVTLAACNDWILYFSGCCRTSAITNLQNPGSTGNYVFATLDNSSQDNNLAKSFSSQYVYTPTGQAQSYYVNAYDLDGDSLVYKLANPKEGSSGVNLPYVGGLSVTSPIVGSINLDSHTGELTFTTMPSLNQLAIIGIEVEEYRNGTLIATSNKDIKLVAYNVFNNSNPSFTITNIQGGYLDQNVFHTDGSMPLTFDIIATDTLNPTDTLTFSTTLNGSFSTSGANPTTASFTWLPSSPSFQEFTITIVDNVCSPLAAGGQYFGYAILNSGNCVPDSVQGIVAADSLFKIATTVCGSNNPSFTSVSSSSTPNGVLAVDTVLNCIGYTAGSSFQVNETFWVYYTLSNGTSDSIWVDLTTVSCVWAGDADTNHIVNHFDLLPIGLGYGETGPLRPNAGIDYDCEPALNFANSTPSTVINYKHSDTDGNGIVNADDTAAILLNWGQIHAKNSSVSATGVIPFYVRHTTALPGDVLQIPIILGDSINPADSVYGVAFTINYDETMTEQNSVAVDFNTSWLGTINTDMISVQKDFYSQGKIDVAVVRTDQMNRNGTGQIGTFNLTIKDDILRKATNQRLDLLISDVRLITNIETELTTTTPPTDVLVSIITPINTIKPAAIYVTAFPNPANTTIQIQSNDEIKQVSLYNMAGQEMKSILTQRNNAQLDVQLLPSGIYMLKVQTTYGMSTQKVQIVR